ncbi:MAG: glycosyltransferase family 39 protein [Chloroflexota bacterium]|nr:glycosyltransferase family 39 protein [Chloroflexota bacterium]
MKPWLPEEAASQGKSTTETDRVLPDDSATVVTGEHANGRAGSPPIAPTQSDGHSPDGASASLPVRRPSYGNDEPPLLAPAPLERAAAPKRQSKLHALATGALWLLGTKGLWLGALGVAVAMYAQKALIVDKELVASIRWYVLAIFLVLVGWHTTYRNKSVLVEVVPEESGERKEPEPTVVAAAEHPAQAPAASTLPVRVKSRVEGTVAAYSGPTTPATTTLPVRSRTRLEVAPATATAPQAKAASKTAGALGMLRSRFHGLVQDWPRYLVISVALLLNLYSANVLRGNYYSAVGGVGWLMSLGLLMTAFIGERRPKLRDPNAAAIDNEDRDRVRMVFLVELAFVLAIVALAFFLRVYRLDDLTGGMHGDEGETGMDAINIMEGGTVSPFMTGWFAHPNFSFFAAAGSMAIFGKDLFGLRILSTILSVLMLVPFYLLVRMWFGVRTALIAGILLAIMDVSIYFGKLGLNNIMTPFFLVGGIFFLARGLRSMRSLDFVLAGYSAMLTLYFYFAGRLTPFLLAAMLGYLFVLMPLVGLPGAYLALRRSDKLRSRVHALRGALLGQWRRVTPYFPKLIVFAVASICMASPWGVFYLDHQVEMNARSNDKFVLYPTNEPRMANEYQATHDPLYLGLRVPTNNDIYPFLPVVFEQTPLSVKVADDGFFARVFWGQANKTLSMFTYRADNSSFFTFTGEPAAKPIEAALLILGIVWALWKWRDHRLAILSIWFWGTVVAGGVLTIDAPYMPRMVGLVPVLAIFIALPLNKMAAEFYNAFGRVRAARPTRRARWQPKVARAVPAMLIVGTLVYLGLQNATDYDRFLNTYPFRDVAGQAYFVREMNKQVVAEGKPIPYYYDLGMHQLYWGHGDNRFVNHGTPGEDMTNPTNELPVIDTEGRDVVFMVWALNRHYLSVLRTYYPGGTEKDFVYGPPDNPSNLLTSYRVTSEQLDAHRTMRATYRPATGTPVERLEGGIGSSMPPPDGLAFPATASWAGSIVAPSMGRYRLAIEAPVGGNLIVNGTQVLSTTAQTPRVETELLLARGPHQITLTGAMPDAAAQVTLKWAPAGMELGPVAQQYLWNGPGQGLFGQISSQAGLDVAAVPGVAPTVQPKAISSRVDGFLGFRHSPDATIGGPLYATWTGTLNIVDPGLYVFDVHSNGDSAVFVDDKLVTVIRANGQPVQAGGQVELNPGPHKYELRYTWSSGTGYLEAFWTPPGRERVLLGPDVLRTDAGIIDPATLASEPPPADIPTPGQQPTSADQTRQPKAVLGSDAGMKEPRGLGVDKAGNMYVGDKGNNRVIVLGPDGKVIRTWGASVPADYKPEQGEAPEGTFGDINDVAVAEGADGVTYVYVLDALQRVQVFTAEGTQVGTYSATDLGLYGPNGAAIGPADEGGGGQRLYISSTGQNRVVNLPAFEEYQDAPQGTTLAQMAQSIEGNEGDRLEQPVDSVAHPTNPGILYSIDLKDRIVQLQLQTPFGNADATGTPTPVAWRISKQWRVPVGRAEGGSRLAISPDGKQVYMSDPDRSRVAVLNTETGLVSYFGTDGSGEGQFKGPSGIAVAPDGTLYVLERVNNRVQVFDMGETPK